MFPICIDEWKMKEMKPELDQESKEGVPCNAYWKQELIIERDCYPP